MSCCTLLKKVKTRLPGGFAAVEQVDDVAEAAFFVLECRRCLRSAQGSASEPSDRLLPSAS